MVNRWVSDKKPEKVKFMVAVTPSANTDRDDWVIRVSHVNRFGTETMVGTLIYFSGDQDAAVDAALVELNKARHRHNHLQTPAYFIEETDYS